MEKDKTERFKRLCVSILAQSDNCQASQHDFGATTTIQEMCSQWRKYWKGFLMEVPQQIVEAFDMYYPDFKKEINEAGFFYNEDSLNGIVIVGNSDNPIHLYLARNAYAIGKARTVLHGSAKITSQHPDAVIELLDSSSAYVKQGYAIARNRSNLTTASEAECHDSCKVQITDATLHDHGHYQIYAYGTATIDTFTDRNITLYDNSHLTIRK